MSEIDVNQLFYYCMNSLVAYKNKEAEVDFDYILTKLNWIHERRDDLGKLYCIDKLENINSVKFELTYADTVGALTVFATFTQDALEVLLIK